MVYRFADPFSGLRDFQRALDSTRLSDWFGSGTAGTGAFPAVNVFAKGEDCVITAELPGVKKTDIEVNVQGNQVRIRGKKVISYDDSVSVHRRERSSGQFDRTVTMPIEVDSSKVTARYEDGILAVHLPRAESDKPRSVSIS